jgi:glycosyltransferase involved in cell wall biosynthesis
MPDIRFLIIATGYNCENYVKKCYESVLHQTCTNWKLIMISDGSTDKTNMELRDIEGKTIVEIYDTNEGAAKRRYEAIRQYGDEMDIIVLLGTDDELLPDALMEIREQYKLGKWMTYGNWVDQWGDPNNVSLPFPEDVHSDRSYRSVSYRATAPNTFYKFLFDRIPESDFQLNGKWIDTTTESEVMFSCLEMCGKEKIGVIEKPIYIYNRLLTNGTQKRLGQAYKNQVYSEIIKRPKKELLRGLYDTI